MSPRRFVTDPILIVDDEQSWLHTVSMFFRSAGLNNLVLCNDSREVPARMKNEKFSLVLLDLNMPGLPGEELLEILSQEDPGLPVIVVTGADQLDTGIRCMRLGAFDYFVKSSEMDRLLVSVQRAITVQELSRENLRLRERLVEGGIQHPEAFQDIVTQDSRMKGVFQYIEAIAPSPRPVLIMGESGVGKELIAQALHHLSERKGEFVAVNSAGLDDQMCSDALFGHVSGAYTGAEKPRAGLVERARGGTLFLDEIGDMSAGSQSKLLRLLQEGEYTPLGSDVSKRSDARIVVATNRDLWALQEEGKFRRDLFYRISTHSVSVPPLRERLADIPLLIDHFIHKAADVLGKDPPAAPPQLFALFKSYSFPGNVRELEAMVFDAVSQHSGHTLPLESFKSHLHDFQRSLRPELDHANPSEGVWVAFSDPLPTLDQVADLLVDEALRRAHGSQSTAAAMLGISRQALNKRVHLKNPTRDAATPSS